MLVNALDVIVRPTLCRYTDLTVCKLLHDLRFVGEQLTLVVKCLLQSLLCHPDRDDNKLLHEQ